MQDKWYGHFYVKAPSEKGINDNTVCVKLHDGI